MAQKVSQRVEVTQSGHTIRNQSKGQGTSCCANCARHSQFWTVKVTRLGDLLQFGLLWESLEPCFWPILGDLWSYFCKKILELSKELGNLDFYNWATFQHPYYCVNGCHCIYKQLETIESIRIKVQNNIQNYLWNLLATSRATFSWIIRSHWTIRSL